MLSFFNKGNLRYLIGADMVEKTVPEMKQAELEQTTDTNIRAF